MTISRDQIQEVASSLHKHVAGSGVLARPIRQAALAMEALDKAMAETGTEVLCVEEPAPAPAPVPEGEPDGGQGEELTGDGSGEALPEVKVLDVTVTPDLEADDGAAMADAAEALGLGENVGLPEGYKERVEGTLSDPTVDLGPEATPAPETVAEDGAGATEEASEVPEGVQSA